MSHPRTRTSRVLNIAVGLFLSMSLLVQGDMSAVRGSKLAQQGSCVQWTRAINPSEPTRTNVLIRVSASAPDDMWAVGYSIGEDGARTLALHFDGKEWKIVPTPNPHPGDNYLEGVSTLGPRDAWAVGDSGTHDNPGAILLHWDGNIWASVPIPPMEGFDAQLLSIVALAPNNVWAVGPMGNIFDSSGVVLHYDGVKWSLAYDEGGGTFSSILYGIDARSPDDIWAVGTRQIRGSARDFQVHWDGTSWNEAQHDDYRMRDAYDVALSPQSDARWVVGNNPRDAAILRFAGDKMESAGRELNKGVTHQLRGAIAVSDTEAWVVGFGQTEKTRTPILAYTTNGSDWQHAQIPPTRGSAELYDIIAVPGRPGNFVAVGGDNGEALIYVSSNPCAPPPQPQPTATGVSSRPSVPTAHPTFNPTPIPRENESSQHFPETGKTVKGIFLDHWLGNGGLPQQGYPISETFTEVSSLNGKTYTVQYFERAVFEYHPENQPPHNVLLSQLGTFQYKQKYPNGAPNQTPNTSPGSQLFPETGKRVGGKFLEYWKSHGGLAQQGYPISEEFVEKSDLNGREYLVQYFERAVFEYHPENQPPHDVLLSQLGTFQHKQKYGGR